MLLTVTEMTSYISYIITYIDLTYHDWRHANYQQEASCIVDGHIVTLALSTNGFMCHRQVRYQPRILAIVYNHSVTHKLLSM